MKRIFLIIALLLLPVYLFSQINWLNDITAAKAAAIKKGKLIVLDFSASWCEPCRVMEMRLWSIPEMEELSDRLIFLKIDVDYDRGTAMYYHVNSIPNVIIINVKGDVLWEQIGYSGSNEPYLQIFRQIPGDVFQLNAKLLPFLQKKETIQDQFELGKTYQVLGKNQSNTSLRGSFLNLSNTCFNKVEKKQTNQSKEAELRTVLNFVYNGKPKKALSILEKLPGNYFGEELNELTSFTKALCFKQTGENDSLILRLKSITNPEYLAELNKK